MSSLHSVHGQPPATEEFSLADLASSICSRRLEVPAIFILELYKPLTGIFHASVLAGTPLINVIFGKSAAAKLSWLLESRGRIEELIQAIEAIVDQRPRK